MFGTEQVQHADNFLKQKPNANAVSFHRDPGGKAVCEIFDGSQVIATGEGDGLLDALKDALTKAGISK